MRPNRYVETSMPMWKGVFIIIIFLFSVDGKAQDQYKVNASVLNVRSLPSTQGAKKGVLYKDAIVDVYEFSKDSSWAHIRSNSLNGWVYRKYLEPITPIEIVIETSNQQDIETQIINFIEKYYQEKQLYWIILISALLLFVGLAFGASKCGMLSPHLWRLGIIIALMLILGNYVRTLRWVYPAIISFLLFYTLLFTKLSATKAAKVIRWVIWGICFGAVWFSDIDFAVWLIAILVGLVNWIFFCALSKGLETRECPYCNKYAAHPLIHSELISREYRTEYAGEKRIGGGVVRFKSSEISDVPYSINRASYDEYQYDKHEEEYQCVKCHTYFKCIRSDRQLVARDV